MKRFAGVPDSSPPDSADEPARGESEQPRSSSSLGELHGRIVQVSRLATIGEMASGIAHEINQPLTAIANYAQACDRLLGRADADREEVRAALREIAAQAIRAGDILRRLRSLARSQVMNRLPVDINITVEEIRELMLAEARIHGAKIEFELGSALPPVLIDAAHIQHVILNLVRNGLQALEAEAPMLRTLRVRTEATEEGGVEIAICDTGPGMSPEALGRLFDPFFSTKPDGTGLGLAISHTVVRAHGGTLRYRSNVPKGSCFSVRLPAEEKSEKRA